ncbi:MAG: SufD family Fe-S cluster assembly protein [Campylobacterales bacterium]|nr:SufD family Fe-S cluster assembly protein [Campylobacterales bacterium]
MKLAVFKHKTKEELCGLLRTDPAKDPLLARFITLGLPNKKSEAYRYFPIEPLLEKEYDRAVFIPKPIKEDQRIEIENGIVKCAPKGIRVYYKNNRHVDMEHFDPFYYLGHLLASNVIMIEIDGDVEVELLHRFTLPNTLIPYRLVIKNQANRHATLFESFEGEHAKSSLILYGYDLWTAKESSLRIVNNQTIQNDGYALIASHKFTVEKQANLVYKTFDFGDAAALNLFKADLDDYAHIDAGHLLYTTGNAIGGTVSQIVHKGEHSTSRQEAKNILDDHSRGIFDALIRVEHHAKYAKAYQNSKSILLGDDAYMAAKPQLEIYIDELEASHGATTGQLDPKQLFYLRSRGISQTEARKMLVIAFANTLIETIKDVRHQEEIKMSFEKTFYAQAKG